MKTVISLLLAALLAGCSPIRVSDILDSIDGPGKTDIEVSSVGNAVPKDEPYSRTGNSPYTVYGKVYVPLKSSAGFKERGIASWYGKKFHGKRTSSGETYDMYAMTAAHKTLPLPTYVSVTNVKNGKKVIVKVNDRGPFIGTRIIDLSYTAAEKLDLIKAGTGEVIVEAVSSGSQPSVAASGNSGSAYFLQAGSFSSESNAKQLSRKLSNGGIRNVSVNNSVVNGATLYKVVAGPFKKVEVVEAMMKDMSSILNFEPYLIVE